MDTSRRSGYLESRDFEKRYLSEFVMSVRRWNSAGIPIYAYLRDVSSSRPALWSPQPGGSRREHLRNDHMLRALSRKLRFRER